MSAHDVELINGKASGKGLSIGIVFIDFKGLEGQKLLAKACLERGFKTFLLVMKGHEHEMGRELYEQFPKDIIYSLTPDEFAHLEGIDIFVASDQRSLIYPERSKVVLFGHSIDLGTRTPEEVADTLVDWGVFADFYFVTYPESRQLNDSMLQGLRHPEGIFERNTCDDFHLIPGGYMNFDARLKRFASEQKTPDAIVYAPTALPLDVARVDSRPILTALLNNFPDYKIIYMVNHEDMRDPFVQQLSKDFSKYPNFIDHGFEPSMFALARAATVITDSSGVGSTFPLYSLRPSIHCRLAGESFSEGPFGYVLRGENNLLQAVKEALGEKARWHKNLEETRDSLLLRPGSSYEYLADNLPSLLKKVPSSWKKVERHGIADNEISLDDCIKRWKKTHYFLRDRYISYAEDRWGLNGETALLRLAQDKSDCFSCILHKNESDNSTSLQFLDYAKTKNKLSENAKYVVWSTEEHYDSYYRQPINSTDKSGLIGFITPEGFHCEEGFPSWATISEAMQATPDMIIFGASMNVKQNIIYDIGEQCGLITNYIGNPHYLMQEAKELLLEGNKEKAKDFYLKCIRADSDTPEPHIQLAQLYYAENQIDQAIQSLQRAIWLDGFNPSTLRDMGRFLMLSGDYDGAESILQRAQSLTPSNSSIHIQLSIVHEKKDELEEAISEALKAISIEDDAKYYSHLGNLLFKAGELEEAEKAQRKAIALNADLFNPPYQLFLILTAMSQPQKAGMELDNAIKAIRYAIDSNSNSGLHINLKEMLLLKGDSASLEEAESIQ